MDRYAHPLNSLFPLHFYHVSLLLCNHEEMMALLPRFPEKKPFMKCNIQVTVTVTFQTKLTVPILLECLSLAHFWKTIEMVSPFFFDKETSVAIKECCLKTNTRSTLEKCFVKIFFYLISWTQIYFA